jgi:hypothetical protein
MARLCDAVATSNLNPVGADGDALKNGLGLGGIWSVGQTCLKGRRGSPQTCDAVSVHLCCRTIRCLSRGNNVQRLTVVGPFIQHSVSEATG